MKLFALLTFFVLYLGSCQGAEVIESLAAQERSIGSNIVDALEALKIVLENGSEKWGMPVMSPAKVSHKKFDFGTGELSATGEVNDLVLEGLSGFDIIIMHVNIFRRFLEYEINFGSLNVTTQYEADVGSGYRVKRNGGAFLALEDLNISGKISYSLLSAFRVKSIETKVVVGNVVSDIENLSKYRIFNRKLNEVIEEFITLTINDNTEYVSEWIDGIVTPLCNNLIGDRTLGDLLGLIGGGGGGNSKQ